MEIKIGEVTHELKYNFNSFKYMEDLNFAEMQSLDVSPLKIIKILTILLQGAINFDRKATVVYTRGKVEDMIETYAEENGNIIELFDMLTTNLMDTSFFKSLQKEKMGN